MIVCVYMYYCKQGNIPLVSFSSLLPSSSADEFLKDFVNSIVSNYLSLNTTTYGRNSLQL